MVYQRTSTGRQGKGGLGMDTQYAAVVEFVRQRGGTIVAQYVELDAGRAGIDQGRRRPGAVNARPSQYLTPYSLGAAPPSSAGLATAAAVADSARWVVAL